MEGADRRYRLTEAGNQTENFAKPMGEQLSLFELAIDGFDAANREDPISENFNGKQYPKELLYAQRMSDWLARLEPDASEELKLAARSQHICRWTIPRDEFPRNRGGYLRWRSTLARFHAEKAAAVLRDAGYDNNIIERVGALLRKENLKTNPDTQLLEDVAALVFLEFYLADFSVQHEKAKVLNIIRRTWRKMSSRGHEAALDIELPPELRRLVSEAIDE